MKQTSKKLLSNLLIENGLSFLNSEDIDLSIKLYCELNKIDEIIFRTRLTEYHDRLYNRVWQPNEQDRYYELVELYTHRLLEG